MARPRSCLSHTDSHGTAGSKDDCLIEIFFFFFFFSIIILMLIMSNKVYTNSIKLIQACNLLRYIKLNK